MGHTHNYHSHWSALSTSILPEWASLIYRETSRTLSVATHDPSAERSREVQPRSHTEAFDTQLIMYPAFLHPAVGHEGRPLAIAEQTHNKGSCNQQRPLSSCYKVFSQTRIFCFHVLTKQSVGVKKLSAWQHKRSNAKRIRPEICVFP